MLDTHNFSHSKWAVVSLNNKPLQPKCQWSVRNAKCHIIYQHLSKIKWAVAQLVNSSSHSRRKPMAPMALLHNNARPALLHLPKLSVKQ